MSEQVMTNEGFERQFREDSNFWWRVEPGYAQNAYADALERINDLRSEIAAHLCTEAALREEIAELKADRDEWMVMAGGFGYECDTLQAENKRLREALEDARHRLTTLSGLWVDDTNPGFNAWRIDEAAFIALIDAALSISPTHAATPDGDGDSHGGDTTHTEGAES